MDEAWEYARFEDEEEWSEYGDADSDNGFAGVTLMN